MPTVGFRTNNFRVLEGDGGKRQLLLQIELSAAAPAPVTVSYSTQVRAYGSAIAGQDFVATVGQVTFAAGELVQFIPVEVFGDTSYEADENFYVDLTAATGATIVVDGAEGLRNSWQVVHLENDDVSPLPTVGFSRTSLSIQEGSGGGVTKALLQVELSRVSSTPVTAYYSTQSHGSGSATASVDFAPAISEITFAPGELVKFIPIDIFADSEYEPDEIFYVDLTGTSGGGALVLNGAEGFRSTWQAVHIENDDASTNVTAAFATNNSSVTEGSSGGTKLHQLKIELSRAASAPVTVQYSTQSMTFGSATAGFDFVPAVGEVTFAPGELVKFFAVAIVADSTHEPNETFYVELVSAQGARIVTDGAEGFRNSWQAVHITNDDPAPTPLPPGFDGLAYIASHADLRAALGANAPAGEKHYMEHGGREGRTVTFSGLSYIASYSDLQHAFGLDARAGARHYIEHGVAEGRLVTFDAMAYLATYPDLRQAFGTNADAAARHYIEHGVREGRTVDFDGLSYIASYEDLRAAFGVDASAGARHFVAHGAAEGRHVSFDALAYIASHADLRQAFGTDARMGALHYLMHGIAEERTITFDATQYVLGYDDLRAAFGFDPRTAARHFVEHGAREGRSTALEAWTGTDAPEVIAPGTPGAHFLRGQGGADALQGGPGNDLIEGGAGADQLTGGAGVDVFRFMQQDGVADTITDFTSGQDKLQFAASAFGGWTGGAPAAGWVTAGQALPARPVFVHEAATGALRFDPDGSGAGAAVPVALLGAGTTLLASDLLFL